jgi:hypothetical protein
MGKYIATVSVPVLVRVAVEAENIEAAKESAPYCVEAVQVIDAAQWGRFENERIRIYEIEEQGEF